MTGEMERLSRNLVDRARSMTPIDCNFLKIARSYYISHVANQTFSKLHQLLRSVGTERVQNAC
jgi:hypothetical protein